VDAVARAQNIAPALSKRAEQYDAPAEFPSEDVNDIRNEGLLSLLVPERLGGMGASFHDYVQVAMTLSSANGSTGLIFNMHACVTGALATLPRELLQNLGVGESFFDVRDDILRRAANGAIYGVAITEREAGSRLSALRTEYGDDGDGYWIRGHKSVCSGAGRLDGYLVAARRSDHDDADPVISYFLVPDDAGIEVHATWDPLGMRATASNEVVLDAKVPRSALLGGIEGLVLPLAHLMPQWLVASYAAVYVGVARAAVDEAVSYVSDRTVAGQRGGLARLPHVRARLGRAETEVECARLMLEEAARRIDIAAGEPETNRWIYRAKLKAGDVAMETAAAVTEACGLGALRRGVALERIYRDARFGALMPPSSDVCADYLGAAVCGLDPTTQGAHPW